MKTVMADGIYNDKNTRIMIDISNMLTENRNLYEWYEGIFSQYNAKNGHIIDWGAGVGRLVPLFLKQEPQKITLVEPSVQSIKFLKEKYKDVGTIEIQKDKMGAIVNRVLLPEQTFHLCNFVINCIEDLEWAFNCLEKSIYPGEKLFVFTNAFAPQEIVDQITDSKASSAIEIDISSFATYNGKFPRSRTFYEKILSTGQMLNDSVHTLTDYAKYFIAHNSEWAVLSASLMLPDGVSHLIAPGENFGDFKDANLTIELIRK